MSRVVAVVQARMGSQRFPGKMMRRLGSYPIITWVLTRVSHASTVDQVVLATSSARENDVLEEVAGALNIPTFRGDEQDVLGRYLAASRRFEIGHIVRVCGDNPFVAPEEIDRLVEFYRREGPDYAFNHSPCNGNNYPDGLGAEIFSRSLLERLDAVVKEPRHREHVTLYLWENPEGVRMKTIQAPAEIAFPAIRLDVDTQADLDKLNELDCVADLHATALAVVQSYRTCHTGAESKVER